MTIMMIVVALLVYFIAPKITGNVVWAVTGTSSSQVYSTSEVYNKIQVNANFYNRTEINGLLQPKTTKMDVLNMLSRCDIKDFDPRIEGNCTSKCRTYGSDVVATNAFIAIFYNTSSGGKDVFVYTWLDPNGDLTRYIDEFLEMMGLSRGNLIYNQYGCECCGFPSAQRGTRTTNWLAQSRSIR